VVEAHEGAGARIATRFTNLVGCTVPVQQAGMGALAPPELTAAVSEAGGLSVFARRRSPQPRLAAT
jgi:NAD(P)H-dependent flavin oxidoreductase YrpB (nitropropane dioxygenase family)